MLAFSSKKIQGLVTELQSTIHAHLLLLPCLWDIFSKLHKLDVSNVLFYFLCLISFTCLPTSLMAISFYITDFLSEIIFFLHKFLSLAVFQVYIKSENVLIIILFLKESFAWYTILHGQELSHHFEDIPLLLIFHSCCWEVCCLSIFF